MKLWLISQDKRGGYDTYDSAVVAAETEADARLIHPNGYADLNPDVAANPYDAWTTRVEDVACQFLGDAAPDVKRGVICASFNAG